MPRVLLTLAVEVEQIMKGGFDHYMQKEIHEQPESLLQTMRGRVQFQRPAVSSHTLPRACTTSRYISYVAMHACKYGICAHM